MNAEPPSPQPLDSLAPAETAAARSQSWMAGIMLLGIFSCVFLVVWMTQPIVLRAAKNPGKTTATNNARQIGMALYDFELKYGRFPDAATIAKVKAETGSTWDLRDETSNDLFKQLLVAGITSSEEMFYAEGAGSRRPDNVISSEAKALAPGECGFAYVSGLSLAGNSSRPIAIAPVVPGERKFDRKLFDGRAVVLRMDNSITSFPISADGRLVAPDGGDPLDPSHPYWGPDDRPVIKWPAPKP